MHLQAEGPAAAGEAARTGGGGSEWARGWPVVVSSTVGMICATGNLGALGVVMGPLQQRFGWSRAQIAASVMIACVAVTIASPVAGLLLQRFGARRVGLTGLPLLMLALAAVGLTGPALWSWFLVWAVLGLLTPLASTLVWTMGIGRRFDRQRGMAFAVVGAGSGIGFFISPLAAAALLPPFGWRGVYPGIAAGCLLLGWPVIWLLFRPDEDPAPHRPGVPAAPMPPPAGPSGGDVLRRPRYWFLVLAASLLGFAVGGMMVHLLPIMRDAGMPLWQAAKYASLIGPASIVGNLVAGRLLDSAPTRLVATLAFAAPGVAAAILLDYHGGAVQSAAAAILLGAAAGIEANVLAYLVSRHFGLRAYGVSFGILIGAFSLTYGTSPVVAGLVFGRYASYRPVLVAWLLGLLASVLLVQMMGRPPAFEAAGPHPAD